MTARWDRWRRLAGVGCVVALAVAGCTSTEPDSPPDNTAPSTVEESKKAEPKDRDNRAVLAALRRIDMCALLASAAATDYPDKRLRAWQPFSCDMGPVSVTATGFPSEFRRPLPVRTYGGAKAYLENLADSCQVYFPVSFRLVLMFELPRSDSETDDCASVEGPMTAAATTLADPAPVEGADRWDACSALSAALGADADQYRLRTNFLYQCHPAESVEFMLELRYRSQLLPSEKRTIETIGGHQVAVADGQGASGQVCLAEWRHGPADTPHASAPDFFVDVSATSCARAKELAESVMTVLKTPPPTDVPPQRPLLYRPDEPDMGG